MGRTFWKRAKRFFDKADRFKDFFDTQLETCVDISVLGKAEIGDDGIVCRIWIFNTGILCQATSACSYTSTPIVKHDRARDLASPLESVNKRCATMGDAHHLTKVFPELLQEACKGGYGVWSTILSNATWHSN